MAQNNQIILIGNLGQDPVVKTDSQGREFIYFTLCTRDSYKDQNDQWVEKAPQWHTIFAFSPTVQEHAKYFSQGQRLKVQGSLTYQTSGQDENGYDLKQASITARRIEAAPLVSQKSPSAITEA